MASPAGRRVSVDSAASPAVRPEIATPRVRTVSGESAASLCPPAKDAGSARSDTGASDSEEPLDDSAFHARHAVLEKAERKANKSVYCTAQYRQAVDRARQRQKEQEKALRSHRGAADAGERASDKRQHRGQDAGDGGGHRKRQRAGRGPSDAVRSRFARILFRALLCDRRRVCGCRIRTRSVRRWAILPNIPHPLRVAAGVAYPARAAVLRSGRSCAGGTCTSKAR